jgi:hypothetical protein
MTTPSLIFTETMMVTMRLPCRRHFAGDADQRFFCAFGSEKTSGTTPVVCRVLRSTEASAMGLAVSAAEQESVLCHSGEGDQPLGSSPGYAT